MSVKINLGQSMGITPDAIYGQFIEHLGTCINGGVYDPESAFADETGVRTDVVELSKRLAPPVLRFPGGTVMHIYHWEDAIGPMESRIRRKNIIWGGELDPSFGTAEFVMFCRKIGTEPMICVNMASGTPEEAGNWVEYCNGTGNTYYANLRRSHGYDEPFNVKYWCIGNECYAEPDIGTQHDVSIYIRDAKEFIKFMKLTDKSIKTVLVGCDDESWNKGVLDAMHGMCDYLSLHHYSGEGDKGLYGPFEGEKALKAMVGSAAKLAAEYPDKVTDFPKWYRFPPRENGVMLAIDEWNIWNYADDGAYGLNARYNWRDAVWVASVMNYLLTEPRIAMANMAQMVNIIAPIIAEEKGAWYQTIAYPWLLYRNRMLGERIAVSYEPVMLDGGDAGEIEALSVCALKGGDGVLRIAAVNRDFANDIAISLGVSGKAKVTTLYADDPFAVNALGENCVKQEEREAETDAIVLKAGSVNLIEI